MTTENTTESSVISRRTILRTTANAAWLVPAQIQKLFGMLADRTGSFDLGLALAGFLPLLAVIPLWLFWNNSKTSPP